MRHASRRENRFGSRSRLFGSLLATVGLCVLAACTALEQPQSAGNTTPGISAPPANETFPNLGSVPDQAPAARSSEERQKELETLSADRTAGQSPDGVAAPGPGEAPPPPQPAPEPMAGEPVAPAPLPAPAPASAAQNAPFAYQQPAGRPASYASGTVMVDMGAVDGRASDTETTVVGGYPAAASAAYAPLPGATPAAVIYFADGSAGLDDEDRRALQNMLAYHRQQGGAFRIVGHASRDGRSTESAAAARANMEMSWARANAVASELIRNGIDPGAVQTVGAGDSQPRYVETSPTGIAANRRAEIYFVY
ncbi:MAG: OmpA family protein [Dongiaceae bacterium]